MIESFGAVVVGGNYAVGLVVFAILVIINFVVAFAVSAMTPPPPKEIQDMVENIRLPGEKLNWKINQKV